MWMCVRMNVWGARCARVGPWMQKGPKRHQDRWPASQWPYKITQSGGQPAFLTRRHSNDAKSTAPTHCSQRHKLTKSCKTKRELDSTRGTLATFRQHLKVLAPKGLCIATRPATLYSCDAYTCMRKQCANLTSAAVESASVNRTWVWVAISQSARDWRAVGKFNGKKRLTATRNRDHR